MIKPPIPSNEKQRLESLRMLRLLDTPPEERFDRITRLAKRAFAVETALVSIVDQNRQWFKSRQGLDATETPREISFCGHAILRDEVLVVGDATQDERFHDNPLVTCAPSIRFYAGYPIKAPDGHRIGTLCVIDPAPREFSDEDVALLRELGEMVEEELVNDSLLTTDPVTGLSNLHGVEAVAEYLMPVCARMQKSLSLQVFCLENTRGELPDDRRVAEFAELLESTFRESDLVARVDEDLFAVLLAGTGEMGLAAADHRLGKLVAAHNERQLGGADIRYAKGTASYDPARHATVLDVINDARQALADVASAIA